jgi:ectoine hydroxylase-related dioxygenase (phytanoyl-CoA dioxygenase family)
MRIMASGATASGVLSADQLGDYERDGFLVLRGLFDPAEIAALEAESAALLTRKELIETENIRCRWQNHVETGECLFECFDPVIDIGPICHGVAHDARILNALAAIYNGPAALFKDKLIFKPPGARGYNLHQDYISWKSFPTTFVTVLVPIDAADADNGATEVFAGCHQRGYLCPTDGMYHDLPEAEVAGARNVVLDLRPGDIAIFGCFTPHRSAPNRSARWRRQLYLSYNALADGGEQRQRHYDEFHAWLRERYAEYGKHHVHFR